MSAFSPFESLILLITIFTRRRAEMSGDETVNRIDVALAGVKERRVISCKDMLEFKLTEIAKLIYQSMQWR